MFYVYVIKRNNGEILYIGFTRNFKKRMSAHIKGRTAERGKTFVLIYSFESEIDARISELYLINKVRPKGNRDIPNGVCSYPEIPFNRDEEAEKEINLKLVTPEDLREARGMNYDIENDIKHLLGAY